MIRINLLPVKAAQKKEKLKGQLFVALMTLVVVGGVCGLVYMHFLTKVQEKQDVIGQKRLEISQLMKTIGEVNQFKKRQQELRAKLDVLAKLQEARSGPVFLLDELYRAMPDKLWITSFKESNGSAVISGVGVNEETVALFMRNLESSEYYSDVVLKVAQQIVQRDKGAVGGIKFHKFDLSCKTSNTKPDIKVEGAVKKPKSSGT